MDEHHTACGGPVQPVPQWADVDIDMQVRCRWCPTCRSITDQFATTERTAS